MQLRDIKLVDLRRSKLDTGELDATISKRGVIEEKLEKLKEPKTEVAKAKYLEKQAKLSKELQEARGEVEAIEKQCKEDKKAGKYVFKNKVYISWRDPATRPPHYVKWNRNTPYDVEGWKVKWNYSEVTIEDPYWPEGVKPNEEGHYVYRTDMILMKCPLENYVEKRKKEIMRSEMASRAKLKEFEDTAKRLGTTVEKQVEGRVYNEL